MELIYNLNFLYLKYSRHSDLKIRISGDPQKSLALHQDKSAFYSVYPEDKKGHGENWISK